MAQALEARVPRKSYTYRANTRSAHCERGWRRRSEARVRRAMEAALAAGIMLSAEDVELVARKKLRKPARG